VQGLARRVDQALGDGLAAVGEPVVVDDTAPSNRTSLLGT
jgi:hypothetical protein